MTSERPISSLLSTRPFAPPRTLAAAQRFFARVALVGCAKMKRRGEHAACRLYTSPLFRKALDHARAHVGYHTFILSAYYGLLPLYERARTYDRSMAQLGSAERAEWASGVLAELVWRYPVGGPVELVVYAGELYAGPLRAELAREQARGWFAGWTVTEPMRGMQVGERLRFLGRRAA